MPDGNGAESIGRHCRELRTAGTRGELGGRIAALVLRHSPADIQRMKRNFETRVREISPDYRDRLSRKITGHLIGTFQRIRLAEQAGTFRTMNTALDGRNARYWEMVEEQCRSDGQGDEPALRFLKYLLAGYCMLVLDEPAHPVGTPFPGGDSVQAGDGVCYCPVRDKAGDVDAALCPFCPALPTPPIGYLRPPLNPTEHSRQEFIEHCHRFHNFNG